MKKAMKRAAGLFLSFAMMLGMIMPAFAQENQAANAGTAEKVNDTWYYHSDNDAKYTFEKISHPDRGAGEIDGFLDESDSRSQSYAWSAIESGDYIYVGTCYNSTYGIYYRNVMQMMMQAGKTQAEAAKIARDFVQFMFNDRFDETLIPRGIIVKFHKQTGEFSLVYDSKQSEDPVMKATACSGYRMAFGFHEKLYFVSLANPTMFLLEIDPQNGDACEIAFKRSLSAAGSKKQIASGVHGLIVYDDEILMCLADEASDGSKWLDGEEHPEGGLIVASKDGRTWRVIADENDLGPSAYHNYDGLMGGGIWDIIEFNGHVYVTVVTDLTDPATGIVNKQGFSMYRGTKGADGDFTWEMMIGDTEQEGVKHPYGLGTSYAMACNLWVYDGHLYLGTYNDPMLDLTEVPARTNFEPLYWDLYYSINLYRMDTEENIELIGGRENEEFPEVKGNMGAGLGDCSNQYVWRMTEHDGKLWIGTYDTSTLTSVFTQLTDSSLVGMSKEEYLKRVEQIRKLVTSLGILQEENETLFNMIFGNDLTRKLFDAAQRFVDASVGQSDPAQPYVEFVTAYNEFKDRVTNARIPALMRPAYDKLVEILDLTIFSPMDEILEEIKTPVFYFGVNYFMKQATQGFDLLVTEDGVNFEVVTNDGFGDPSNHGVRILISADDGENLFVGTANPFYGGQIWKLTDEIKDTPEVPSDKITIEFVTGADGTFAEGAEVKYEIEKGAAVPAVPAVTAGEGYKFEGWKVQNDEQIYSTEEVKAMKFTESTVISAVYAKESITPPEDQKEYVTVRFDGSTHGELVGAAEMEVQAGTSLATVPAVNVEEGYRFAGWESDGVVYSSIQVRNMTITEDTVFTAVYKTAIVGDWFEDVKEDDFFYDAVKWAVENGITDGYLDNQFAPEKECIRAQIVTFLWRVEGTPKASDDQCVFEDVEKDSYYYEAMLWACEEGIAEGYTEKEFGPYDPCTRAQIVTFIHRTLDKPQAENRTVTFTDVDENAYYYDAVLWAVETGVTEGYSETVFAPDAIVTRGETVTFIYRTYR